MLSLFSFGVPLEASVALGLTMTSVGISVSLCTCPLVVIAPSIASLSDSDITVSLRSGDVEMSSLCPRHSVTTTPGDLSLTTLRLALVSFSSIVSFVSDIGERSDFNS